MQSTHLSSSRSIPAIALSFLAVTFTCTWLSWSGEAAMAQTSTSAGMLVAAETKSTPKGTAKASKITEDAAAQIALKAVPGQVTGVVIEKKGGKSVYVVEILAQADGVETDVFVDIVTGEVVGIDK